MYRVWIGNRESEILTYNVFNESITYYGSNSDSNHAFSCKIRRPNDYCYDFKTFVINAINRIIKEHSEVECHFYNPMFAHKIVKEEPTLKKYFANINEYETLKWVTSKTFVREWLSNSVSVPAYALLSKSECNHSYLNSLFSGFSEFVVQKDISGGGEGTYLLTIDSESDVHSKFKTGVLYLVSPYYTPKLSVCCHMLISEENITVLPFGIQQSEITDNRILYTGTQYRDVINQISNVESELLMNATTVGNRLQCLGYRGICGLDFILHNNNTLFIEVNARYLGSSFLINKTLFENNLPSLFDFNSWCFNSKEQIPSATLRSLKVDYCSNTVKSKSYLYQDDIIRIVDMNKKRKSIITYYDGLESATGVQENSYLYREIY